MSCVLRIAGKKFNLDAFLKSSSLKPDAIFRKGEPRVKNKPTSRNTESCVNIVVSKAGFDRHKSQINNAIKFLKKNKSNLKRIVVSRKIQAELTIDFGIYKRNVVIQNDEYPKELLLLLGSIGINLQTTLYP